MILNTTTTKHLTTMSKANEPVFSSTEDQMKHEIRKIFHDLVDTFNRYGHTVDYMDVSVSQANKSEDRKEYTVKIIKTKKFKIQQHEDTNSNF